MSISHLLEDFSAYTRGRPVSLTDVSLEEQKLEAFEKGYQAGWDDSVKAQTDDSRHISADLSQNLQELSFTFQEASAAVLTALNPLLQQMVRQVLPKLAFQSMGEQVTELLTDLAREHGKQPVEIVTAPANVTALEVLLEEETALTVEVKSEPSLGEGQVYLRFGEIEREIDLSAVLDGISTAVSGFFEEHQKEIA